MSGRTAVVFIHGIFSSGETWSDFTDLLTNDEAVADFDIFHFSYWSPKLRINRLKRIPDFNVLGREFGTFLDLNLDEYKAIVIVAHSQGGLITQRFLAQRIGDARATELGNIKGILLYATPNSGSELALFLRRFFKVWRNPQERQLRPLNGEVSRTHALVLERIVYASKNDSTSHKIPIKAYVAASDNIVGPESGAGMFPGYDVLAGDHFSIIEAKSPTSTNYVALRKELLRVKRLFETDTVPPKEVEELDSSEVAPVSDLVSETFATRHNLPSQSSFFGRNTEIARAIEGLLSASAVTTIEGLGGTGKSALALRIGWHFAEKISATQADYFSAVVWCSRELGITSHDRLLDEIIAVLNYPYVRGLTMPEKENTLLKLLQQERCLVIVDNLDDLADMSIHSFIARLSASSAESKVLVTTRVRYQGDAWQVLLGGLDRTAGLAFIRSEALRLNIAGIQQSDEATLGRYHAATGGNPLAIRLTAGQIRDEGISIQDLIADLESAVDGDIFNSLFHRTWFETLADAHAAKMLLCALSIHPAGASRDALAFATNLPSRHLRDTIRYCVTLCLIDPQTPTPGGGVRYYMHPLTRFFVRRQLTRDPEAHEALEGQLIQYYLLYAQRHSETYVDESNIKRLEGERENILGFADLAFWAAQREDSPRHWQTILSYADSLAAFLWGRGYWRDRLAMSERGVLAATKLSDSVALGRQHILIGRVHLWLNNNGQARQHLNLAQTVTSGASLFDRVPVRRLEAQLASAEGDNSRATEILEEILQIASPTVDDEGRTATLIELGVAAERDDNYLRAADFFREALRDDEAFHTTEGAAVSLSHLANALFELDNLDEAKHCYERGLSLARRVERLSTIGRCQFGLARVMMVQGESDLARERAKEAEDTFLRLGMTSHAQEAHLLASRSSSTGSRTNIPAHGPSMSEPLFGYRGVIFDCDDTIVATARNRWSVLIRTAASFGEHLTEDAIRAAWGLPFNALIKEIVPDLNFDEFVAAYRISMSAQRPELLPGVGLILDYLDRKETKYVIVTSSSRDLVLQDLREFGMADRFLSIYGYEQTMHHKPDPRVLDSPIEYLESLGIKRNEILYVGDSARDASAAHGQGIDFVAVLSGLEGADDFASLSTPPTLVIDRLDELTMHSIPAEQGPPNSEDQNDRS